MSGLDEALNSAVVGVTKKWAKQRKAEERSARARQRRADVFRAPAYTIKDAADDCMEEAYDKVSANGTLSANARQIMYAARPLIQAATGKELDANYFTQTLLPDYIERYGRQDWYVAYDARGNFREPHTKKSVPLGTIEVRRYLGDKPNSTDNIPELSLDYPTSGPTHRFSAVLFIEKEGFDALLADVKIAARYDIAIMSTKGMSVTAARELVERLDCPLLVLHDFDQAGFAIIGTLRRSTRRYQFTRYVDVIDAGVRLFDIEELGLQSEYQHCTHKAWKLRQNGATAEDIAFLQQHQRVELNAMTSDQLIALIERRLDEAGITKVVPEADTLETAYRRAYRITLLNKAIEEASEEAETKATPDELDIPDDLESQVRDLLNDQPEQPWDDVIASLATKALEGSA